MADILIDTDVLIDHLRGARRLRLGDDAIHYSVMSRCELYAGRPAEEARIDRLLAPFRELGVDRGIAERAGRLRRDTAVRTPDAIIAATAIEHGLTLRSRNRRDFDAIPDLRLEAPSADH